METTIHPTQQQVDHWIEKYVPEIDLFFLRKKDLSLFQSDLQGTLVLPWKIVDWVELEEEWKRFTPQVYRRVS